MRHLDRVVLVGAILMWATTLSGSTQGGDLQRPDASDFHEPEVWRSQNGILHGVLEVKRAPWSLGRRQTLTLTYNGSIPGPTWRVKPGDHMQVRLINNGTLSARALSAAALTRDRGALARVAHHHDLAAFHGPASIFSGGIVPAETPDTLRTNIHTHGLQVDPRATATTPSSTSPPASTSTTASPSRPTSQRASTGTTRIATWRSPGSSGTVWRGPSSWRGDSTPCRRWPRLASACS